MSGRTYHIKTTMLDPDIESGAKPRSHPLYFTGADDITIETPFLVLDGAWVLETSFNSDLFGETGGFSYRVLGPRPQTIVTERRGNFLSGFNTCLLVGAEPFAVLEFERAPRGEVSGTAKHFKGARQIHKGELGQLAPIPSLHFAREAKPYAKEWITKPRSNNRGYVGWARLTELVEVSGLTLEQILLDYWDFVDFKDEPWHAHQAKLDMIHSVFASDIDRKPPLPAMSSKVEEWAVKATRERNSSVGALYDVFRRDCTKQELEQMLSEHTIWDNLWVRKGFANTILRLQALDYQPKIVQSA